MYVRNKPGKKKKKKKKKIRKMSKGEETISGPIRF